MKRSGIIWLALFLATNVHGWNSALLTLHGSQLVYHTDNDGYVLPDFSHAGYKGADADIPLLTVVRTISPISGDNTAHVQAAIDAVGAMPLVDGVRGAVLMQKGTYSVAGTIKIPYDGVVLRGEGIGQTVIHATGDSPHQRDVIIIGADKRIWGASEKSGTRQTIQDELVPAGALSITVENGAAYTVGQQLIIYHPCSASWLAAVNYGGVPYPDPSNPQNDDERWIEDQYPVTYHRYITAISGNIISIDAPIFYTLQKSLSTSYVYEPKMTGTIYGSGIEDLTVEIESAGGEDEDHAWNAVRFRSIENAWAQDCEFSGFGQAGIVTEACRRSSFIRCRAVDPVAITTGERKYNFNTYLHSQLNLFADCYARAGRHNYISNGTSGTSGNVFLNCISDGALNVNEGHRGWTQGMLYDNHRDVNMVRPFTLGLYNRVAMGTGHGWAAVQSVLWNCDVDANYGTIGLQKPPTAQNYAIGCKAKKITGKPINDSDFPIGHVEGQNIDGLEPQSLYLAQLAARHATNPTENIIVSDHPVMAIIDATLTIQNDINSLVILTPDGKEVYAATHLRKNDVLTTFQGMHGIFFACIIINNQQLVQKIVL